MLLVVPTQFWLKVSISKSDVSTSLLVPEIIAIMENGKLHFFKNVTTIKDAETKHVQRLVQTRCK